MSRLARRLRRINWAIVAPLLGACVGWLCATFFAGHFTTPEPLDEPGWQLVSPMLDETVREPAAGRGTHVLDGALVITEHVFYRTDTVRIRLPEDVKVIEVELASDSGRLGVLAGQGPMSRMEVTPKSVTLYQPESREYPLATPLVRLVRDGTTWAAEFGSERVLLTRLDPNVLEFETVSGRSRLRRLRIEDASGNVFINRDFSGDGLPSNAVWWGLLLGALAGWATGQRQRASDGGGWFWGGVWLALPFLVCLISPATWLEVVETTYLTETTAWDLARIVLGVSFVPLVLSGVFGVPGVALDRRSLRRGRGADRVVWAVLALLAVALGGQGLSALGMTALGVFVVLPLWMVFREGLSPDSWLRRDCPALVAVIVLGWGAGVFFALIWRWALVMNSLSLLIRQAPRATAELAFVMLLALPVSVEAAARASYLSEVWTPEGLQVGFVSEDGWSDVAVGWSASCGPDTAERVYRVAYAGGSSTGGAYQFGEDSEAFFPAQAHRRLCAALPEGVRLESYNFGDGDRTSFTISRTLEQLVDLSSPDLLVLYLGVNDIFTQRHSKTSKQREEEHEARSSSQNLLARLGASSRVAVGLGASLRAKGRAVGTYVSDVPVEDAAENVEYIAATIEQAQVVVMTEQVQTGNRRVLRPYDAMLRRLGEQIENVHFVDVESGFGSDRIDGLLADRNHLTREGNRELGGLLAPEIRQVFRWPEPE